MRVADLCGCLLAGLILAGCSPRRPVPTVPGPEATDLASGVRGYVLMDHPVGGLNAVQLPTGQELVVRPTRDGDVAAGTVYTLSGPDTQGRIVFVDGFMQAKRHEVSVVQVDGTRSRRLFERRGDPLWDNAIGESLALAPVGGQVALIEAMHGAQMRNPSALLEEGALEVWSIDQGRGGPRDVTVLDEGLSWFPDGKRLAYAALVPSAQVGALPLAPDGFGAEWRDWQRIPVVFVLDTATGARTKVQVGWQPVVSSDGKSLLVLDMRRRARLVPWPTGTARPVTVPGLWHNGLALLDGRRLLYRALPTAGMKAAWAPQASPLVGSRPMLSLKVADLATGRFQTVIPQLDWHLRLSFGAASPAGTAK